MMNPIFPKTVAPARQETNVNRKGFTLLEVTLAISIALVLMYGLYLAIEVQLGYSEKGRATIEQATVARSLFERISNDVAPGIGIPDPGRFKESQEQAAEEGATEEGAEEEVPLDPGVISGDELSNLHTIVGSESELIVFVSRVPRDQYVESQTNEDVDAGLEDDQPISSDQRRIRYWLAEANGQIIGLARQEEKTASGVVLEDLDPDETGRDEEYLLASEVKEIQFRYWDGEQWTSNWDGNLAGSDGVVPIGPPLAIEILLTLQDPNSTRARTYRHVIHVPTAGGPEVVQEGEVTP